MDAKYLTQDQLDSLVDKSGKYRVLNATELIGFGGIQYMTYNYDDAEWADYIANNTLEY